MPGAVIPRRVDRIIQRVQSLTRSSSAGVTEMMSDCEGSSSQLLTKSKSGRLFSAFAIRRTRSMPRVGSPPADVPQGSLPVYVGAERKRFVISTKYLSHPLFKALLKRSEEEFGFNHQGGLAIACDPHMFEHLLWMIGSDNPAVRKDMKPESLELGEGEGICVQFKLFLPTPLLLWLPVSRRGQHPPKAVELVASPGWITCVNTLYRPGGNCQRWFIVTGLILYRIRVLQCLPILGVDSRAVLMKPWPESAP
ncbi:hypothetical protein R1sor_004648 [Riccia sorocarpa]|uniref:Small auxin up regulated protein n=1 Tax=Riccia sorocarpa TaxID=122646 RepID=A0ABD3HK84_9MARC